MALKKYNFDQDCMQLIRLLLAQHAIDNSDFARYGKINIGEKLQFEIANRALYIFGYAQIPTKPPEVKK